MTDSYKKLNDEDRKTLNEMIKLFIKSFIERRNERIKKTINQYLEDIDTKSKEKIKNTNLGIELKPLLGKKTKFSNDKMNMPRMKNKK